MADSPVYRQPSLGEPAVTLQRWQTAQCMGSPAWGSLPSVRSAVRQYSAQAAHLGGAPHQCPEPL